MKIPSNATLKRRVKEYRCPFCGSRQRSIIDSYVEYPERCTEIRCGKCNKILSWTDNSPWFDFIEDISHIKGLNWRKLRKLYRFFIP